MEKVSPKQYLKNQKKVLLLAQDIKYAKNLAANEEKVRKKALKYLKKYLEHKSKASPLTEENLQVLWKGLFYAMWMSDKPLVQEECAENIAHLIHCLPFNEAMLFFKTGLTTLQNEWIGIDQLRLDKFLMFVRRLLRQAVFVLKKCNFKKHPNQVFTKVLEDTILNVTKVPPLGLFMHFTEIYLEEIAKVSDGTLQQSRTLDFIRPYIMRLAFANDNREINWINKYIFTYLMKQHKLGLEYEDKYKIWKMQGFVGSINQIQKVLVPNDAWDDEEPDNSERKQSSQNKSLDPRAGRVNVEIPQIFFNAKEIAEALLEPKTDTKTSKNTRNHLTIWSDKFLKLYKGVYPLGIKKLDSNKRKSRDNYDTNVTKAAKRLIKFEQQLLSRDDQTNDKETEHDDAYSDITPKKKKKMEQVEINDKISNLKETKNKSNKKVKATKLEENTKNLKSDKKAQIMDSKKTNMKNKLQEKIKEKKKKQSKTSKINGLSDDDNYCFERNSGIWFVTPEVVNNTEIHSQIESHLSKNRKKGRKISSGSSTKDVLSSSPEKKTENRLEDGEYEIFIPSRKFVKKMKKNKTNHEVEQILNKLRGKSGTSLKNLSSKHDLNKQSPKKQKSSLGSPKKVKINTKLNISQEIDDHILQVISSPQVPYDSSKKPGKPLLKTPIKSSPINPFYRLKTF